MDKARRRAGKGLAKGAKVVEQGFISIIGVHSATRSPVICSGGEAAPVLMNMASST